MSNFGNFKGQTEVTDYCLNVGPPSLTSVEHANNIVFANNSDLIDQ